MSEAAGQPETVEAGKWCLYGKEVPAAPLQPMSCAGEANVADLSDFPIEIWNI